MKPRYRQGSSWAATAAAFGTLATQLPAPYNLGCFGMAALATLLGIWMSDSENAP